MVTLIVLSVLSALPAAYEVDFGPLTVEPQGAYEYTIVLSFKGEPDVKIPTTIARKYGPEGAASLFFEGLDDSRWKVKVDKSRVTVYGYDDIRILRLKVEGDGVLPVVRRVIAIPPEKKK